MKISCCSTAHVEQHPSCALQLVRLPLNALPAFRHRDSTAARKYNLMSIRRRWRVVQRPENGSSGAGNDKDADVHSFIQGMQGHKNNWMRCLKSWPEDVQEFNSLIDHTAVRHLSKWNIPPAEADVATWIENETRNWNRLESFIGYFVSKWWIIKLFPIWENLTF